ncbi:MAG TPA: hypothetical protein VME44_25090 [Streptosporangiaceae bacterium]|nr:hypothetical protein [Streptosporangiaceae bacterium]
MTASFEHPSYLGRLSRDRATQAQRSGFAEPSAPYRRDGRHCERACCCSAQAAVVVMLPPTQARPHATDLLLCGHHFRQSRAGLLAKGATFLDLDGCPLAADGWLLPASAR